MLSGIRCTVCGKALEHPEYLKDGNQSLYFMDPKICDLTDVVVNFCGPEHTMEWVKSRRAGLS